MISKLWVESRALTVAAGIMLVDLLFNLAGVATDTRMVTGAGVWLKPAKFAISTAIFAMSIAWLFRYLPDFGSTKRWIGPALGAILLLEVGIIDFQAARGTTSHYNISTVQDAALFSIMGASIGILWVVTLWILVTLFRQRFDDAAWGWALRLGLLVSVLGLGSGGLMLRLTSEQAAALARHEHLTAAGGHTVGAPDGGRGLGVVGWSKEHGDLRIPHFVGMHALQIVPFVVWWWRRKATIRFVFSIAASYLVLYAILTWQALRGESIVEPSAVTLTVLGIWSAMTVGAAVWSSNSMDVVTPPNGAATG